MPRPHSSSAQQSSKLHPRNRHQGRYDFTRLVAGDSALAGFVTCNDYGESSIDFADPAAVKALNRALLKNDYGIQEWNIPEQQLCPPVPGRADYLHYLADLLISTNKGVLPKKNLLSVLDIGTGANGIYPLIGVSEYGWQFTASDINPASLANVQRILDANPKLAAKISLLLQPSANAIFKNIVGEDDWFDLSMCNPPFHASMAEAQAGTQRKWNNLGKAKLADATAPTLNFGGRDAELWCPGGEFAFIERMINESAGIPGRCFWFTTLVSKSENLPALKTALKRVKALEIKEVAMSQGNKQSRFLAWTFLTPAQQAAWKKLRW
ncbi:23S rRNA (adenine(1618)-N(6))-methyltransferase RlmF [Undibacterium sp. FT147W]|uniref:Ribosomal RNA large subunit methyltransferase F n=1 Tax=Undibacterium rivi TaxID=2828729 RepID=A0ABS5GY11_9BURK|nr:23S rRNA (adenine(1618)-N(6))-methyltransferase RlmF [Undibacterium rivi]MBR7791348.1 23S rRNA (adenine(1618)-N(6))-methyltransferase RlmF [Undibacterium rivi]